MFQQLVRRALRVIPLLACGAMLGCAVHVAPPPGGGADKVTICHKDKQTLSVAESALRAHLRHGDTRGPCR